MAFENVELLKEEIKEYQIPNYRVIRPGVGTIDREKNIKLFYYGHKFEELNENYFIFVWEENVIKITMLREIKGNTVKWSLGGMNIPKDCLIDKEDVLKELRNAMQVYCYSGYSLFKSFDAITEINF